MAESYTSLARAAWDEAAPIHWRTTAQLVEKFKEASVSFLTEYHVAELRRIGLQGSSIAQLNCNNGRETISLVREGAAFAVGFDISSGFIEQAKELATAATSPARFEVADIYEIGEEHNRQYDIVVVTSGALCFMPDLDGYFAVAQRLLKPGGYLNIYDCHPITDMFELDRDRKGKPLEFVRSYFDKAPFSHKTGLDYVGGTTYDASEIFYFHYTLGDIINAVISSGFAIDKFDETGEDPSRAFPDIERREIKPPLSFLLTARKA